jgi:hypothetical protein
MNHGEHGGTAKYEREWRRVAVCAVVNAPFP